MGGGHVAVGGLVLHLFVLVAPLVAAGRGTGEAILYPTADTWVFDEKNDTNFGLSEELLVHGHSRMAYLRFHMGDGCIRVLNASLVLSCVDAPSDDADENPPVAQLVEDAGEWTDTDITYANQPSVDEVGRPRSSRGTYNADKGIVTIDVTSFMEEEHQTSASDEKEFTFRVLSDGDGRDHMTFASRESPDVFKRPFLHLRTSPMRSCELGGAASELRPLLIILSLIAVCITATYVILYVIAKRHDANPEASSSFIYRLRMRLEGFMVPKPAPGTLRGGAGEMEVLARGNPQPREEEVMFRAPVAPGEADDDDETSLNDAELDDILEGG